MKKEIEKPRWIKTLVVTNCISMTDPELCGEEIRKVLEEHRIGERERNKKKGKEKEREEEEEEEEREEAILCFQTTQRVRLIYLSRKLYFLWEIS